MNYNLEYIEKLRIHELRDYARKLGVSSPTTMKKEELVEKIKELQKKYIRSGYDDSIKEKLDSLEEKLYSIPIYFTYKRHLDEVNRMINYVKDEMNDYFYKILN